MNGTAQRGLPVEASLQVTSISLKNGGAITWSVRNQTKPAVTTIPKMISNPMSSTRRFGILFGKAEGIVDMAHSFLLGKQVWYVDRVIEGDYRIAFLLMTVCLPFNRLSVLWRTPVNKIKEPAREGWLCMKHFERCLSNEESLCYDVN